MHDDNHHRPAPALAAPTAGAATAAPNRAERSATARKPRVPNYVIPDRVIVGGALPDTGVTYYDVPQTYGPTPYRYTVVNGRTVLVEPRSRRIVQVVE